MIQIGIIKKGKDLGYTTSQHYIWVACPVCGKERWVQVVKGLAKYTSCHKCATQGINVGVKHHNWKGGRVKGHDYFLIRVYPGDTYYPMANTDGYVFEHRLVVAKALGRCLHSWEVVHHKGTKFPKGSKENKGDNRYPENLELMDVGQHRCVTILETKIGRLIRKQKELTQEVRTLKLAHRLLQNRLYERTQSRK